MRHLIIRKRLLLSIAAAMALASTAAAAPKGTLTSPDGRLSVKVTTQKGRLYYSLQRGGTALINSSALGMDITAQGEKAALLDGITGVTYKQSSKDETWQQPWGEEAVVRNNYNEMAVSAKQKDGRTVTVRFRLFNDGMGFRYEFPVQQRLKDFVITEELTEFNFAEDAQTWSQPTNGVNYHESLYLKAPISQKDTISTPATMEVNDSLFMTVHEANLTDYAALNLAVRPGHKMVAALTPWQNGDKVRVSETRQSPWRCVIVASRAGDLITSRLLLNLNEPCKIEDTSWIEPGRYIGIWWSIHKKKDTWEMGEHHGATTGNIKRYIDFAAKHDFAGVLAEGWNPGWGEGEKVTYLKSYPDCDIEAVSKYALDKGLRFIGHMESWGRAQLIEDEMDRAFAWFQKMGIRAVKTGYVGQLLDGKERNTSQYGVRHYRKVIETAAKYQIMIDNHEPAMPTGIQRTWPNLMTQEGVRGQEYNAWDVKGGNPPAHTVTLPFTRGLAGPTDFTPAIFNFSEVVKGTHPHSTLAKQLGEFVVIYSPLQMAADAIENYEGQPALTFIESCPTTWDKTVVPNAEIGKYVTVARKERGGDKWFIGSITNEESRTVTVPLTFLDADKKYCATIYEDGPDADYETNPYSMAIRQIEVTSGSTITLNLARSGGAAIRISPSLTLP